MVLLTHCAARYDGCQRAVCVGCGESLSVSQTQPHAVPTGALKEMESCVVFTNIAACQRTNGVSLQFQSDMAMFLECFF